MINGWVDITVSKQSTQFWQMTMPWQDSRKNWATGKREYTRYAWILELFIPVHVSDRVCKITSFGIHNHIRICQKHCSPYAYMWIISGTLSSAYTTTQGILNPDHMVLY